MSNKFNENEIVLKFPVISDLHIMGKGAETSKKLQKVYDISKREIDPDVIMFAGDITDFGLKEQIEEFKEITMSNFDLHKTKLFFAIGNHELYNNELLNAPLTVSQDFLEVFGDCIYFGASEDEVKASNHHAIIKDYDFIAINAYKYSGGVDYRSEDIDWLKKSLESAVERCPDKPIFVCGHPMIVGTNYGSNYGSYWAGSTLYDVFKKYPQVIYFAGHLHFPLQNEETIWQKEFTTVGTSSIYFSSLEDKNKAGIAYNDIVIGSETADCHEFSQGMFVEVDSDANTRITRYDFWHDKRIKQPWLITAPDKEKSQLQSFTKQAHLQGKMPPKFPTNAKIEETIKDISSPIPTYQIKFTAAACEDMTFEYEISFVEAQTEEIIKTVAVYSDFYNSPQQTDMQKELTKTFTPSKLLPFTPFYSKDYYIKITPKNSFSMPGIPLKSSIIAACTIKTKDALADLPENAASKVLLNFEQHQPGAALEYNHDYFAWPPLERGDGASPHIIISTPVGNGVCAKINSKCYQFYAYCSNHNDFSECNQICFWADFSDIKFQRLYFAINDGNNEYTTDDRNGCDMKAYIQKQGKWQSISFNFDGCLENFGNYTGFIRFSTDYFFSNGLQKKAGLKDVHGFKIGFSCQDDEECAGKTYSLSDIKFIKRQ